MVKRFVVILLALFVAGTGVASAGDGYADDDTITVSCPNPAVGDTCTVTVSGFQPGTTVTLSLFSDSVTEPIVLGSGVADDSGTATITFTVPNVAPDAYTLEAAGTGIDGVPLTVATSLTIGAAGAGGAGAGAGGLPRTGSDSTTPMGQIAVAAIAGGGLLLLIANKRRSAHTKINVDA